MQRRTKRDISGNPVIIGLAALVAVLLITSASFNTPLITVVESGGEATSLNFSLIGLPLLAILVLAILLLRVKK